MSTNDDDAPGVRKTRKSRISPEKRSDVLLMLGLGYTVQAVADAFDLQWHTVAALRDSPEGQDYLTKARQERHAQIRRRAETTLQIALDNAHLAMNTLCDLMQNSLVDAVRRACANDLLGYCAVNAVEVKPGIILEAEKLSTLPLETLKHLKLARETLRGMSTTK